MKDSLERVIEKIILPHYKDIIGFDIDLAQRPIHSLFLSKKISAIDEQKTYLVWYWVDAAMSVSEKDRLRDETESLFMMLNPESNDFIDVVIKGKRT